MALKEGVYENLINEELKKKIEEARQTDMVCKRDDIDKAEASEMLAEYVARVVKEKIGDEDMPVEEKIGYVNNILRALDRDDKGELISDDSMYLSAVVSKQREAEREASHSSAIRPLSGFRVSNLFTGGQSALSLGDEIMRDIASADSILMIVSFLKMTGIRIIIEGLRKFCSVEGHTLKIITTTYCGVTEGKAVEQLSELPNTEIRISYNTEIERLHAKSYIFLRNSGFNTAYIGSSNLSKSAQTDGLEWNIRVTNVENPHIIKTAVATFERYWASPNFEDFKIGGLEKFNERLNIEKRPRGEIALYQRYTLLPHQKQILDKLSVERKVNDNYRNLIVAATGTGKTVISAFDYQRVKREMGGQCRLLFVAHRQEILKQSLNTFRSVLGDYNFGELWVGDNRPTNGLDHLFVSVQTFNANKQTLKDVGENYYDYIVVDEAHHIAADSYREIANFFRPKIFIGLTATPERMDGQSLLPDFGNKISAEIRLPRALDEGLLTPFQYLCITDSADLSDEEIWKNGKYVTSMLSAKLSTNERVDLIVNKLRQYLPDETECRALCFCTDKHHAEFMAEGFRRYGLRAASLTSDNNDETRRNLNKQLADGKINYLFVVDIFNEGVDIPEVDTALFLRPTESLTIFLQQLGRGLRLSAGKDYLTVLDFVAQANKSYDFASRFRALSTRPDKNIKDQIDKGPFFLPTGCNILMEQKAKEYILQNVTGAIYNTKRLTNELRQFSKTPTLSEFVEAIGQDVRLIYKGNNCWTSLKREAEKCEYEDDDMTRLLTKKMVSLVHVNTPDYIAYIRKFIQDDCVASHGDVVEERYALMLYYGLFQESLIKTGYNSIYEALETLRGYPLFVEEIGELCDYLADHLECETFPVSYNYPGLMLNGVYTREEVFMILGRQTPYKKMQGSASGVFDLKDKYNTELFFVTINKSDKDFSPTTQYNDYFISDRKFHWQSQNTDSHDGKGQRFVRQKENGKHFLLFVRESVKDGYGQTCPFYCVGLVDYISSHGDRPMNIEWSLEQPALPKFIAAV